VEDLVVVLDYQVEVHQQVVLLALRVVEVVQVPVAVQQS
jgi:hypothetical protein